METGDGMKVLVTGVNGQLGHDVMNELSCRNYMGIGSDITPQYAGADVISSVASMPYIPLDITDQTAVKMVLQREKPDAVIHCAAWTAVDLAEEDDKVSIVRKINVDGTRYIAEGCKQIDAKMLYLSTDYVFDGKGTVPWKPDCQEYHPLNVYGQSKLDGELAIAGILDRYFIVRIAWVFGKNGKNFVKTMINAAKKYDEVRVVDDQIGTPTYTFDLSRLLVDMIETEKYGYYHATNEGGFISWYEFCCEIYRQAGIKIKVIPVSTAEYGLSKAQRPFNSRLDKSDLSRNGFIPLPDWKDAVGRYLREIKEVTDHSNLIIWKTSSFLQQPVSLITNKYFEMKE